MTTSTTSWGTFEDIVNSAEGLNMPTLPSLEYTILLATTTQLLLGVLLDYFLAQKARKTNHGHVSSSMDV